MDMDLDLLKYGLKVERQCLPRHLVQVFFKHFCFETSKVPSACCCSYQDWNIDLICACVKTYVLNIKKGYTQAPKLV